MVESITEKICLDDNVFTIANYSDVSKEVNADEYLVSVIPEECYFVYNVCDVIYSKKLQYIKDTGILCIEYNIQNNNEKNIVFEAIPFVTYKKINLLKDSKLLKFPKMDFEDRKGAKLTLSVINNECLFLKTDNADFFNVNSYAMNVLHKSRLDNDNKTKIWKEDFYIPGDFELRVEARQKCKV